MHPVDTLLGGLVFLTLTHQVTDAHDCLFQDLQQLLLGLADQGLVFGERERLGTDCRDQVGGSGSPSAAVFLERNGLDADHDLVDLLHHQVG